MKGETVNALPRHPFLTLLAGLGSPSGDPGLLYQLEGPYLSLPFLL